MRKNARVTFTSSLDVGRRVTHNFVLYDFRLGNVKVTFCRLNEGEKLFIKEIKRERR